MVNRFTFLGQKSVSKDTDFLREKQPVWNTQLRKAIEKGLENKCFAAGVKYAYFVPWERYFFGGFNIWGFGHIIFFFLLFAGLVHFAILCIKFGCIF